MTRAGIVTVVGRPNAGKSTLLNRLVGEKLAITSPKPQSTRKRIVGILTRDDAQLVVHDTPGLLHPRYALQKAMRSEALAALEDADVIAYLVDGSRGPVEPLQAVARLEAPPRAPVVTVINKADLLAPEARLQLAEANPSALFVSATTGDGMPALVDRLVSLLPESPFLYDAEDVSTQHLRFFVEELVRETALEQLEDEVPYSIACEVEEFREDRDPVYIRVVLFVERESQKHIVIGREGERIRQIGMVARTKVENLLGQRVYLDLWVKVLDNWRRNERSLKRFGFVLPEEPSS
ncbi:MAG TPA: GTPase Era [Gemmatimonadaceae bacterium]|nr:MAG: GTPase Era [Gemmatimonadetes bacterium SCN 70-22]HMN10655.1 GTPase Era [Gemmatimonadaceae bacterium]